jgi:hypothetical protein
MFQGGWKPCPLAEYEAVKAQALAELEKPQLARRKIVEESKEPA